MVNYAKVISGLDTVCSYLIPGYSLGRDAAKAVINAANEKKDYLDAYFETEEQRMMRQFPNGASFTVMSSSNEMWFQEPALTPEFRSSSLLIKDRAPPSYVELYNEGQNSVSHEQLWAILRELQAQQATEQQTDSDWVKSTDVYAPKGETNQQVAPE